MEQTEKLAPGTWRTSNGRVLQISEMAHPHIKNTVEKIKRVCAEDGSSPSDHDGYDALAAELKRRDDEAAAEAQ